VIKVSRSNTSKAATMAGQELIPALTDALKCTLVQVSATGQISWIKRIPQCSDGTLRYALAPKSGTLHVLSKATVDWGAGKFSNLSTQHVLTKFDANGAIAWQEEVITLGNNITTYGHPWLIVADNDIPIVHGYLDESITFGGQTLGNQKEKSGTYFLAFEPTGAPRWLSGIVDCGSVDTAWYSPMARVGGKVALGVLIAGCKANGVAVGASTGDSKWLGLNLVLLHP
jgi:hypothetical protein